MTEQTANDCEQVAKQLTDLAAEIREGNTDAFLEYWHTEGTEEGDAKIFAVREMILLRYYRRKEELGSDSGEEAQTEKEPLK
ncbi:hypothetical protein C4544_01405 [candidate division WS5 bacterium]|uniref:Uncharacterized protein n=1 Tax=candidate division WS5 bacterium TaxID=2093353 RepID=A0A419DFM1_9BACT|nr:MAG: hypothetical protein C4544_01405 [candidate division WS5 bacterium]